MKRLPISLIIGFLIGTSLPALAVQDPKASAAQLDSRLSEVQAEIAEVNAKLPSAHTQPAKKKTLLAKQHSLTSERRALIKAKSRNAELQENPLVRYSGEGSKVSEGARVDKLFEK